MRGAIQRATAFVVASAVATLVLSGCSPAEPRLEPIGGSDTVPTSSLHDASSELEAGQELLATRGRADLVAAAQRFEKAVTLDPELAAAWSGLADSMALLGLYSVATPSATMPRARDAAQRAIKLDPGMARAHASLGLALYLYDWDWSAAEASFETAIQLDPGYASAHHWYAMMLSATGRHREAVERIDSALQADPSSRLLAIKSATVYTAAGDFERAESRLSECLRRFPANSLVRRELGTLRLAQGRLEQAVAAYQQAAELSDSEAKTRADLGYAYALVGRRTEASQILADLERRAEHEMVPPMYLALVHLGLGDREQALNALEQAYRIHDPGLVYLYSQPGLEPLRSEPRFRAVARDIGLPQATSN